MSQFDASYLHHLHYHHHHHPCWDVLAVPGYRLAVQVDISAVVVVVVPAYGSCCNNDPQHLVDVFDVVHGYWNGLNHHRLSRGTCHITSEKITKNN